MISGEILIVLREELRVGEGYHRTIHGSNHCAGIGNARYRSSHTVAYDKVANLYTSRHQRDAVIDVFQKVLRSEADTRRKTSRDDDEPLVADVEYCKARYKPNTVDKYLDYVLHHHYARRRRVRVQLFKIERQEGMDGLIDIMEHKPHNHHKGNAEDAC